MQRQCPSPAYRHDRPGQCPDHVPGTSQPPSTYSLTTCDLTSQRSGWSACARTDGPRRNQPRGIGVRSGRGADRPLDSLL